MSSTTIFALRVEHDAPMAEGNLHGPLIHRLEESWTELAVHANCRFDDLPGQFFKLVAHGCSLHMEEERWTNGRIAKVRKSESAKGKQAGLFPNSCFALSLFRVFVIYRASRTTHSWTDRDIAKERKRGWAVVAN